MPRLTSVCSWPSCQRIATDGTRCAEHQAKMAGIRAEQRKEHDKRYDAKRPEAHRFYSTGAWKRLRDWIRKREPLCRVCAASGHVQPAECVDHIIPFTERPDLALSPDNLQPLCNECHRTKTAHDLAGDRGGKK